MKHDMTANDVDAFMRRLEWLIGGAIAIVLIPVLIYVVYLNRRFDAFEETLQHNPPDALLSDEGGRRDLYHLASNPVEGQVVYVPAYSHIYHTEGEPLLLTITLSVRNTSLDSDITVKSVRYFDTRGVEVRSYLANPVRLPALATTEILIERDDASGGSGANFLVEWYADSAVTEPIIEAVMIDTTSQQGISFARRGSVISEGISEESAVHAAPDER